MSTTPTPRMLLLGAAITCCINGTINGTMAWRRLKEAGPLLITQNAIQGGAPSVVGDAVEAALLLALVFTSISYLTLKMPDKPAWFPRVLLLTVKHTFMVLGVLVTCGVLFQHQLGTIVVDPGTGAVLVGLLAGLTAGTIDLLTKQALVNGPPNLPAEP